MCNRLGLNFGIYTTSSFTLSCIKLVAPITDKRKLIRPRQRVCDPGTHPARGVVHVVHGLHRPSTAVGERLQKSHL